MRSPFCLTAVAAAAALTLSACGGGDSGGSGSSTPPPQPKPTASPSAFPRAASTIQDLQGRLPEGPILAPSVSLLVPGTNRVGFALFDRARKQITGAQVALYTARPDGTGVRGPYIARSESLAVKPAFQSQTTASDPDAAHSVYVADVPFRRRGKTVITAVARLDGRLFAASPFGVVVGRKGAMPPAVGQKAPRVHTPTLADVHGDASKIDTRVPPAKDLLKDDLYDVLGRKPVVLVFATPRLCQSRVCGPVVDVEEQVRATTGDAVSFIHQEVYRDNDIAKGPVPQMAAFRLASEPWTFVIDRKGIVRARFEGAMSAGELERAVAAVKGT